MKFPNFLSRTPGPRMRGCADRTPLLVGMPVCLLAAVAAAATASPLPGTMELTAGEDEAALMVDGMHRFFERETTERAVERAARFAAMHGEAGAWPAQRERMATELYRRLGMEAGVETPRLRLGRPAGALGDRSIMGAAWPVVRDVVSEGLYVAGDARCVVVLPDCGTTPEQSFGLVPGLPADRQWAHRLAADGATVLAMALVDRRSGAQSPEGRVFRYSQREVLWRAAFELGRTMAGYEIQSIRAAAAALRAEHPGATVSVLGTGEGGYLALLAGAALPELSSIAIEGAFESLDTLWEQPLDRTVFGLLKSFGVAELASLIAPRPLTVLDAGWPVVRLTDVGGGAPGALGPPTPEALRQASAPLTPDLQSTLWPNAGPAGRHAFSRHTEGATWLGQTLPPTPTAARSSRPPLAVATITPGSDSGRQARLFHSLLDDTQRLMRQAQARRDDYWKQADLSSAENFTASADAYRQDFWHHTIGHLPPATAPPNPRSRRVYDTPAFTGWEVKLDVYPDVFASGILLIPNDLKPGERRAVVVCQHGLEGRPADVADPSLDHPAYHRYAARLAEKGYIVFAPQNPYRGETRFRQLCQRAWPLGLSLWSVIVRQHETILQWLQSQPAVDPSRIAFYGLSYGGKTAMRVPALLPGYCLSICSADYNEWAWKTIDASSPYCYLHTVEYDMAEWNLAPTFNYAELSRLIFPRPFMVERGSDDGVSCDEWVAYEFARTKRHYTQLGRAQHAEIEFFNGPHTIHGEGTFRFLDRWLNR